MIPIDEPLLSPIAEPHWTAMHFPTPTQMSTTPNTLPQNLIPKSLLYRWHLAEREEILRHKWIESEKAGFDIGFEAARVSWMIQHQAKWRKAWRSRCA